MEYLKKRNTTLTEIKKVNEDVASIKKVLKAKSAERIKLDRKLLDLNMKLFKTKYDADFLVIRNDYIKFIEDNSLKWPHLKWPCDEEAVGHAILIPKYKYGGGLTYMIDPYNYNKCIPDQKTWDAFAILGYPIKLLTKAMKFSEIKWTALELQETFDLSDTSILSK